MSIIADSCDFVIGADTHARTHTLAVVAASGQLAGVRQFPATPAGISRGLAWAHRKAEPATEAVISIEGVASYGAHLARMARAEGLRVIEAPTTTRAPSGKSDPIDAHRIALATLAQPVTQVRHPRTDTGYRPALATLLAARTRMSTARTQDINALTALVRCADLGLDARKALNPTQIGQIAAWRARGEDIATATARAEATRLARHITTLATDLKANLAQISALLAHTPAAALLAITGIGPITAATALVTWSHPGRIRTQAAFAALAGVAPIPASSGNTVRHRLNRRGDRALNHALHMATIVRMTHDGETRTYVEKRRAQGKTDREIRRILKRYLARRIYRTLNTNAT